jgi:pyruvate/2-oxoacid:ferredoxin oxidoreductase beta subunit
MKKQLKSYKFYFQQVNQEAYEVKGFSIDKAYKKAEKEWKQNNNPPMLLSIETLESGIWKTARP